ncbi:MAG TPA: J domain-containing protein [Candidatus Limnocylindrales bacterium]|nr:J domain-containing protein [Candidatus Limnocylindrales bacterium]
MPRQAFRGDPYKVLDVASDASASEIKRRWRDLAREHHPDRAAGDATEAERLTKRMARINAAYDLLRDPERRADYDGSHPGGRRGGVTFGGHQRRPGGPPPPRPERPVTGRFDASELYQRRNATTSTTPPPLRGQRPRSTRDWEAEREPLRASQPTGPVLRGQSRRPAPPPTLAQARDVQIEFGKFRGHTLGEVERFEPTYIDWIARTITRDRDLVAGARVIQADLDARGVERRFRGPATGTATGSRDDAEPRRAAG